MNARASTGYRGRTHRIRSATGLVIVALGLGLLLAAVLGAVVWAIALGLHSASNP